LLQALSSSDCRNFDGASLVGSVPSTISALTALTRLYVADPPPIAWAEMSDAYACIVGVLRGLGLSASLLADKHALRFMFALLGICVVRVRDQMVGEQRVHRDHPGRHLRTDGAPCSVRPGPLSPPASFNQKFSCLRFSGIGVVRVRDQNVGEQRVHWDHPGSRLHADEPLYSVRPGRHAPPASFQAGLWTACGFQVCVSRHSRRTGAWSDG
jgi:hypothetical protein